MQLTYENATQFVKDWFGLVGVLLAVVAGLGFSFSPPWARAEDMSQLKEGLAETRKMVVDTSCLTLRVLIRNAKEDKDAAEKELAANPASTTALRAKAEAEAQIDDIKEQMRDQKCKR